MKNDGLFIPSSVVLELTYKCNHNCLFCSCPWESTDKEKEKYKKGKELSFEQWKQIIDRLQELGVKNISVSGGECLMKEGLLQIIDYIRKKKCFNLNSDIVLISNGRLMNKEYLQAFKHYGIHLSMSLPGIKSFEFLTGVDNAGGVLYWFQEAKKNEIHTTCNITVTKKNFSELYETIANALIYGAETILLNRFLIGGRGLDYIDDLSINNEQINQMLDIAEALLEKTSRYGSVGTEIPLCIIKNKEKYKHLKIGSICSAAKDFFVIDPSGIVRTCNHSPKKVGYIFDKEIIKDKKYWQKFQTRAYIPQTCVKCYNVNQCDCGCREVAYILYKNNNALDFCLQNNNENLKNR